MDKEEGVSFTKVANTIIYCATVSCKGPWASTQPKTQHSYPKIYHENLRNELC